MFNLKQDREKEKTEYYTSGKKAFQERDFAQACRFFHFAEAWKIKKTAWENLKLQIQEKLNKIPEVEDNLTSTSLMLISLSDIEETLSSIPENPEGSDRKPENALFFMFHGQSLDFYYYFEKLKYKKL
ncbi:MAG: hypothetical protein NTU49_01175, partial [Gammaproteobacteria bacterium]|nr:hypothetical protein [Gammaproteobacteria bacterium]